jgi:hypothetical protein
VNAANLLFFSKLSLKTGPVAYSPERPMVQKYVNKEFNINKGRKRRRSAKQKQQHNNTIGSDTTTVQHSNTKGSNSTTVQHIKLLKLPG